MNGNGCSMGQRSHALSEPATGRADFHIEALLTPAAFPHPVARIELRETLISWIVLTGDFAYKIKKAVHFDFLDASTLERRRMLCEEELRLNRRLAADLYLDVVAVTREPAGLRIGGSGPVVEHAVRMRQFAPTDELAQQLAHADLRATEFSAFGLRLARFHREAGVAAADSPYGGYEEVRDQVFENLATLLGTLPGSEDLRLLARLSDWTHAATAALEPLIGLRKASGAVRECHGDLHARNIVRWRGELTPFDCLEFDPALRWIDVASDVAFLFMDLLAHKRADLAYAFLNGYLEESGDFEALRLLPFYAIYRALVRAKVDALSARTASKDVAGGLRARLADRLSVAARFLEPPEAALIIMHGVTASGKSRVSGDLTLALGAVRVRSDLERKRLTGTAPLAHREFDVRAGAYDEASTNRTYARLLECAEAALEAGLHVIVDAAFLDSRQRQLFHALAIERRCPFLIIACSAPRAVLEARLAQRAATGNDPSEATATVLEHQLQVEDALAAHELTHTISLRTDVAASFTYGLEAICARLERAAPCPAAIGA
jgi:aminoglycoside phosphotransferase family enzyme/predicted kinase